MSLAEVEALLAPLNIDRATYPILAVGFRGYYKNSIGKPGVNDRNEYDDALLLITPNAFVSCNANVDPTAAKGAITGRASLKPGFYPMWRLDMHRGKYLAFCQRAAPCVVKRDNTEGYAKGTKHEKWGVCLGDGYWMGWFGINGHRGAVNSTGSEGCTTVPDPQYSGLIAVAEAEARRIWGAKWKQGVIPYILFDQTV